MANAKKKILVELSFDEFKTIENALRIAVVDCVERGKRAKTTKLKLDLRKKENEFHNLENFFYNVKVGYIKIK